MMRFFSIHRLFFSTSLLMLTLLFGYLLVENAPHLRNRKNSFTLQNALRVMNVIKCSSSYIDDVMAYRKKRFDLYRKTQWNRTGPGEQGKPVKLADDEYEKAKQLSFKTGGSFKSVSDMISLDRALPESRSKRCREVVYPELNLTVTVIVTYCNDAPSLILRTVHSVVNRSPPENLKEILLINDHSDHLELGDLLEQEVSVTWPDGVVKVIRTSQRKGVAGARMVGIERAEGDIILTLDAHIEVFTGWLEPLIARLQENPDALICPTLGGIHHDTFEVDPGVAKIWDFTWAMTNQGRVPLHPLPAQPTKPYITMASTGGAWAMIRKTFLALGGYDPGMSAWGGEDFEMALRVWLCAKNGSVEMIPCSIVSHVFRSGPSPYSKNNETETDYIWRNFQRTAEIWLDEYKPLFYYVLPWLKKKKFGDLGYIMKVRKELGCRTFRWFLNNIATHKRIPNIKDISHYGQLLSVSDGRCLDTLSSKNRSPMGLYQCVSKAISTQFFIYILTTKEMIIKLETCMAFINSTDTPWMTPCSGSKNEEWTYNEDTKELLHSSGLCLDATDPKRKEHPFNYVTLIKCNGEPSQKWRWQDKKWPT